MPKNIIRKSNEKVTETSRRYPKVPRFENPEYSPFAKAIRQGTLKGVRLG